jgi:uncharacterized protein with LGFP repeats
MGKTKKELLEEAKELSLDISKGTTYKELQTLVKEAREAAENESPPVVEVVDGEVTKNETDLPDDVVKDAIESAEEIENPEVEEETEEPEEPEEVKETKEEPVVKTFINMTAQTEPVHIDGALVLKGPGEKVYGYINPNPSVFEEV